MKLTRSLLSRSTTRLVSCLLAVIAAACAPVGNATAPAAPTEEWVEVDLELGPGPLDFTEMQTGLDGLSSYQATLTITFEGTEAGAPAQWSSTLVMLHASQPEAWQWTSDHGGRAPSEFVAGRNGMLYALDDAGACLASMLQADDRYTRPEPADELAGVLGAETGTHESVNGIEADGYTFDERALGEAGRAESTGELWLATEGGYLVRYLASTQGDEAFFGQGASGTMTWDYQLSDVNAPVQITLPADCPAGRVDAPRLPDAANVVDVPGWLEYDTATSVAEALAFYEESLPALGWGEPALSVEGEDGQPMPDLTPEELAMLEQFFGSQPAAEETAPSRAYGRGDEILTLSIEQVEGTTHVTLALGRETE